MNDRAHRMNEERRLERQRREDEQRLDDEMQEPSRVRSRSSDVEGDILRNDRGWVTVLWDGSDYGPIDYHDPFTRGVLDIIG